MSDLIYNEVGAGMIDCTLLIAMVAIIFVAVVTLFGWDCGSLASAILVD